MTETERNARRAQAASFLLSARTYRSWAREWERSDIPNGDNRHADLLRSRARRLTIWAREIRAYSLGHAIVVPLAR